MKTGKEVKIFISVLDQDMEFITIRISEDTTAETVIKMVLHSVQMNREPGEASLLRKYWRRMGRREKVLQTQKRWEEDMNKDKSRYL